MKLVSGNSNKPLSESIAKYLGVKLVDATIKKFPDKEIFVEIQENVRGEENSSIINDAVYEGDNLVIENSVYSNTLSDDMMKEIRQELLHHFPPSSQSEKGVGEP